ncbi:hypothetical protein A2Z33_04385 [Candidatus Gottesmanbacteria bacterium RBG_16_52_11]|uniref:Uncharacterized protein n=1 Tax=Candidatus Gottesmanbacteria bacterium RBG_16_52_11 TaxID=1798374 RepID=A0A1F5YW05_9BACT|nr:MAG: hypothetical protein A2Z33_04385 [Candidatus Gottesmanbacteria bacterium RBG_16_52_11]
MSNTLRIILRITLPVIVVAIWLALWPKVVIIRDQQIWIKNNYYIRYTGNFKACSSGGGFFLYVDGRRIESVPTAKPLGTRLPYTCLEGQVKEQIDVRGEAEFAFPAAAVGTVSVHPKPIIIVKWVALLIVVLSAFLLMLYFSRPKEA